MISNLFRLYLLFEGNSSGGDDEKKGAPGARTMPDTSLASGVGK